MPSVRSVQSPLPADPDRPLAAGAARSQPQKPHQGLVIVYTGHGRGKTTAALGLVLRAWGHGLRPCVVQFIKEERARWGETMAAERLGIRWHAVGAGFTFTARDQTRDRERALAGWALAREIIAGGEYDLVVLDEFTYPLSYGWLAPEEVAAWLRQHRPAGVDVVITGRDAVPEILDLADMVTEMVEVKHPFHSGVAARAGMEY
ncbi:MAG: cob(I)yrinic acid a,c-diamide adenosyltransferase [Chloroflexi bacterium]|nr:cob(I)yrinic acid a,c-diamide adenosyltransferase [Chloroflexota bacterium]